MAEVEVRVRNEANTTGTTVLADAFDVSFQVQRNDIGTGSFRLPVGQDLPYDTVVQFLLGGVPRFWCRIDRKRPSPVEESEEGIESAVFSGPGGLVDWERSVVRPPAGVQIIDPVDERAFAWYAADFDDSSWGSAVEYVQQGWLSTFYVGLPAGWRDPTAYWIGPASGDQDDAPDGDNYFRQWVTVAAGPLCLDFAGDNRVTAYVNGRKVGQAGFHQKSRYEFEALDSGQVLLAFRLENFNDPPPGDNPTALLWTLTEGANGDVVANSTDAMAMLEYPGSLPEPDLGTVVETLMADNDLLDGWTFAGTATTDADGNAYPSIGEQVFQLYTDSMWDVLKHFTDVYIDITVDVSGKTVRPYVKGTLGETSTLELVAGYSTAGIADPDSVNVRELSWDMKAAEFDAVAIRYQRGWAVRGSGDKVAALTMAQIRTTAEANDIADGLLDLYGADQETASFELLPASTDEWPFTAFGLFDTLNVPSGDDLDSTSAQVVAAITVSGDEDGDAVFVTEVGSLVEDRIEWLERAARRGLGASLGGRGSIAAPSIPIRAQAVPWGDGQSEWHIAGTPAATVTTSGRWTPPEVRHVQSLRLECVGGTTGSTVVEVLRNGGLVTTLTVAAGDDYAVDETIGELWVTSDAITLACTSVGHGKWDLYAGVARAGL